MNGEININSGEGTPLRTSGAANIFLNTGKVPTPYFKQPDDRTIISLNTEKPTDLGVHINTTLSIGCPKKVKVLFILNFLLSVLCILLSSTLGFYFWNEVTFMRRQLDFMKDQIVYQNVNRVKIEARPLLSGERAFKGIDFGEPGMEAGPKIDLPPEKFNVDDLGGKSLLVDSRTKNPVTEKPPGYVIPSINKEPLVAHFNGAEREKNIRSESILGPWMRDVEVSSKNSEAKIELNNNYVTIKEDGLYLVYAQVVYLSHAPNSYFVWARATGREPRLLTTCATGDDSSDRPIDKSQMSCSIQTVARLHAGDTVNIAQRELHRTLWLRPGYTYFGFVKLSS